MGYSHFDKILFIAKLIKEGRIKYLWTVFVRQIYFEEVAFGFKRDLNKEFKKPRALMELSVRKSDNSDNTFFKDNPNNGLINHFKTCYVAVTKEAIPCSRLWLIDSSQNKKLINIWRGTFPKLKLDELLIENVFTVPKYRGMGIVSVFMHQISEEAKKLGANYVITFGAVNNANTSRAYNYAGFDPYVLRTVKWFLFKKTVVFEEIPNDAIEVYHNHTSRGRSTSR